LDLFDWPSYRPIERLLPRLLVVILYVAVGACSAEPAGDQADSRGLSSADLSVVDDAGRVVELRSPAGRVVSLVPATTEIIVALGAAPLLVARTDYDVDPSVAHLPSVGGGLTPSIEVLGSLRTDLVIAWEEAGTSRLRSQLESLGSTVYANQTRDTAGVYATIDRLGHLLGLDSAADSLNASIRHELNAVRESVADQRRPSVLYLVSLDPPMVAGSELFISEMIGLAGGDNVFADLLAASPQMSLEEIVRRRPEIVLIPYAADSSDLVARLRESPGWRELLASGATRVHALPADILHRPGPAIVPGAQALRDAMHPAVATPQ